MQYRTLLQLLHRSFAALIPCLTNLLRPEGHQLGASSSPMIIQFCVMCNGVKGRSFLPAIMLKKMTVTDGLNSSSLESWKQHCVGRLRVDPNQNFLLVTPNKVSWYDVNATESWHAVSVGNPEVLVEDQASWVIGHGSFRFVRYHSPATQKHFAILIFGW